MGNSRSARRQLNEKKVWFAKKVQAKREEIVKKIVEERLKTDAEFAKDVLKYVGETLPEDLRKNAEETISKQALAVLPEDPLITQNASPNNYPENQGMFRKDE